MTQPIQKPLASHIRPSSLQCEIETPQPSVEHKTKQHSEQANQQAEAIAKKMFAGDAYSHHLGIKFIRTDATYSVCQLTVDEHHSNGHGTCHGGAIFSLADTTFAHACNAHNNIAVGHICTIAYWLPAQMGDVLTAYAYESGVHGRSGSYRIEILNQNEALVAEFQGFSRSLKNKQHF